MTRHLFKREREVLYITGSLVVTMLITVMLFRISNTTAWKISRTFKEDHQVGKDEQRQRTRHVQRLCRYLKNRVQQIKYENIEVKTQIYGVRNVSVCVVPKSGCSFLKQTLYYLGDPERLSNASNLSFVPSLSRLPFVKKLQRDIFHISRRDIHSSIDFRPLKLSFDQFREDTSLKVISTRNPYSRLFSAYIDKIYIPMFDYILKMKQEQWPSKLKRRQLCRTNYVTFEDFLKFIVQMSRNSNGDQHWLPVSSLCDPCKVKPDIIIKQETYSDDILYALSQVNMSETEWGVINSALGKQGLQTDYYLRGMIKTMFYKGTLSSMHCFTELQIAQRVWNALKLQGQIYEHLKFPASTLIPRGKLTDNVVADVFIDAIGDLPITYEESKEQRWRALARAYRNIDSDVIRDIQAMFYYDFMLFGYDINPPKHTEI